MGNLIVILILTGLIGGAIHKIYRDRKNGIKCTGCAHSKTCGQQVHKKSKNEFIIK